MWELPRTSHSCRDQSLSWSSWGKCGLSSDAAADQRGGPQSSRQRCSPLQVILEELEEHSVAAPVERRQQVVIPVLGELIITEFLGSPFRSQ